MQVKGVSLDLTLIMHGQAFGDYLTDHSFLSLESVGWRTGKCRICQKCTDKQEPYGHLTSVSALIDRCDITSVGNIFGESNRISSQLEVCHCYNPFLLL